MKIVILGSAHPLRGGGIATFNEQLASELQAAGHEVLIYSFSLQYPNFLFPGKSQYTEEPAPEGLHIKSLLNSINPLSWWRTGRQLRREKADIIITRFWLPFFGPSLGTVLRLARRKATATIGIVDNAIPHEPRIGDKPLTQYFLASCSAFVAMSRQVLADLQRLRPGAKAVYTPHPLYSNYGDLMPAQLARQRLGLSTTGKYILFFGFIRHYKGLDILLRAMAQPGSEQVELIVAGEFYEQEAEYRALEKTLEIENRVHWFSDFVPNDEVKLYFSAADVVVQPYRTATQSGISQVAYHFAKPMIVTDVGGLAEIVPHGRVGLVVPPRPEPLAEAIGHIFEGDNVQRYTAAMVAERKQFGWDIFIKRILDLAGNMQ